MAQQLVNFIVQPVPVNTVSTSAITLASFDLAAMPGIGGNWTDGTLTVRATIVMFEVGGGSYSTTWEKVAVYRRDTSGNATLVNSVIDGNAGAGGRVGSDDTATVTLDGSTTNVRLRVTPGSSSSRWWWGKLVVTAMQPA
jgi:hypothetical protein